MERADSVTYAAEEGDLVIDETGVERRVGKVHGWYIVLLHAGKVIGRIFNWLEPSSTGSVERTRDAGDDFKNK